MWKLPHQKVYVNDNRLAWLALLACEQALQRSDVQTPGLLCMCRPPQPELLHHKRSMPMTAGLALAHSQQA